MSSVGHAYLPRHGDPETAMTLADEAMYRRKAGTAGRLRAAAV